MKVKNESQFKAIFKKSVRAQRGYAASLAAPMLVGIPDLYVVMGGYIPVLLEAKWLKDINRETFSRKLELTSPQRLFLENCHKVAPYTAMALVGMKYLGTYYAMLVPYWAEKIDQDNFDSSSNVPLDPVSKQFNIVKLFEGVPIPRIATSIPDKDWLRDPKRDQSTLAVPLN